MKKKPKMKLWKKLVIGLVAIVLVFTATLTVFMGVFLEGNGSKYSVSKVEVLPDSPLKGKTILFLGSSVTQGMGSLGTSFVDYLAKADQVDSIKEAVSGTTLVDNGKNSYVQRMLKQDPSLKLDAFVCQLSTNDATKKLELGAIGESKDLTDFDTKTIVGAMEYIIAYASETWDCPVIFYTGTYYEDENYQAMVEALLQLKDKWGIGVIDLWNDKELNDITADQRKLYMKDGIHPTKAGYLEWWTPVIREYLINYLTK